MLKEIRIPMRKSGYYRMFMSEDSYREACYQCPYASLDKPADLTIGDYFELKDDYPEMFVGEDAIDISEGISCIIVHTDKGHDLLREAQRYVWLKEVDINKVQKSHKQLQQPPDYSGRRDKYKKLYNEKGYPSIEKYFLMRNAIVFLPKLILKTIPLNIKNIFNNG